MVKVIMHGALTFWPYSRRLRISSSRHLKWGLQVFAASTPGHGAVHGEPWRGDLRASWMVAQSTPGDREGQVGREVCWGSAY